MSSSESIKPDPGQRRGRSGTHGAVAVRAKRVDGQPLARGSSLILGEGSCERAARGDPGFSSAESAMGRQRFDRISAASMP